MLLDGLRDLKHFLQELMGQTANDTPSGSPVYRAVDSMREARYLSMYRVVRSSELFCGGLNDPQRMPSHLRFDNRGNIVMPENESFMYSIRELATLYRSDRELLQRIIHTTILTESVGRYQCDFEGIEIEGIAAPNGASVGWSPGFPLPAAEQMQWYQIDFERIEIEGISEPILEGHLEVRYRDGHQLFVYVSDAVRFTAADNWIISARHPHWNWIGRRVAIHGIQIQPPNDTSVAGEFGRESRPNHRVSERMEIDILTVTACPDCGGKVNRLGEASHYCLDCDWDDLEGGVFK